VPVEQVGRRVGVLPQHRVEDADVLGDRGGDPALGEEVVAAYRSDPLVDPVQFVGQLTVACRQREPGVEVLARFTPATSSMTAWLTGIAAMPPATQVSSNHACPCGHIDPTDHPLLTVIAMMRPPPPGYADSR
jgi:hypothetical protein